MLPCLHAYDTPYTHVAGMVTRGQGHNAFSIHVSTPYLHHVIRKCPGKINCTWKPKNLGEFFDLMRRAERYIFTEQVKSISGLYTDTVNRFATRPALAPTVVIDAKKVKPFLAAIGYIRVCTIKSHERIKIFSISRNRSRSVSIKKSTQPSSLEISRITIPMFDRIQKIRSLRQNITYPMFKPFRLSSTEKSGASREFDCSSMRRDCDSLTWEFIRPYRWRMVCMVDTQSHKFMAAPIYQSRVSIRGANPVTGRVERLRTNTALCVEKSCNPSSVKLRTRFRVDSNRGLGYPLISHGRCSSPARLWLEAECASTHPASSFIAPRTGSVN